MYAFFVQWSPEIYAEDTGEYTREPGFIVVKKIEESETGEDATGEATAREWEVRRVRLAAASHWLPLHWVGLYNLQCSVDAEKSLKAIHSPCTDVFIE